jgi:hypothetical protein
MVAMKTTRRKMRTTTNRGEEGETETETETGGPLIDRMLPTEVLTIVASHVGGWFRIYRRWEQIWLGAKEEVFREAIRRDGRRRRRQGCGRPGAVRSARPTSLGGCPGQVTSPPSSLSRARFESTRRGRYVQRDALLR